MIRISKGDMSLQNREAYIKKVDDLVFKENIAPDVVENTAASRVLAYEECLEHIKRRDDCMTCIRVHPDRHWFEQHLGFKIHSKKALRKFTQRRNMVENQECFYSLHPGESEISKI